MCIYLDRPETSVLVGVFTEVVDDVGERPAGSDGIHAEVMQGGLLDVVFSARSHWCNVGMPIFDGVGWVGDVSEGG